MSLHTGAVLSSRLGMLLNRQSSLANQMKRTIYLNAGCLAKYGIRQKGRASMLRTFNRRVSELQLKGLWKSINKRSEFVEWNYEAELYAFGKRLSEDFDSELLKTALIQPSYAFKESKSLKVLGMDAPSAVTDNRELLDAGRQIMYDFLPKYLRAIWSSLPEEGIQATTNYLMSLEILGHLAEHLGLKDIILTEEYPPSKESYAECFIAIVAALHRSSGEKRTYRFLQDFLIAKLLAVDLWDVWPIEDPLCMLKLILENNGRGEPEPRIIGEIGKTTIEAAFHIGIYSDHQYIGSGYGETTDIGIKVASYNCLSKLFEQTIAKEPISFKENPLDIPLKDELNPSLQQWKLRNDLMTQSL